MSRINELRLMARVAQMYHVDGLKQSQISRILHISQASISRLLKRAEAEGIVRISIAPPRGTYTDLEAAIRERYGTPEVIVSECQEDRDDAILLSIGVATAHLFETTIGDGEVIGVSSWSATLQHMLDNIHPLRRVRAERVVQLLGGIGLPSAQVHATQLATRLAELSGAEPQLLPAPCVTGSAESKSILLSDPQVKACMDHYPRVTTALVGIGAMSPSPNILYSGNTFSSEELARFEAMGAVGDICMRFYDRDGQPVNSPLQDRVVSIGLDQLRAVPRVVGAAGGARKVEAIRGALMGKLINVLVTDKFTAQRLSEA